MLLVAYFQEAFLAGWTLAEERGHHVRWHKLVCLATDEQRGHVHLTNLLTTRKLVLVEHAENHHG